MVAHHHVLVRRVSLLWGVHFKPVVDLAGVLVELIIWACLRFGLFFRNYTGVFLACGILDYQCWSMRTHRLFFVQCLLLLSQHWRHILVERLERRVSLLDCCRNKRWPCKRSWLFTWLCQIGARVYAIFNGAIFILVVRNLAVRHIGLRGFHLVCHRGVRVNCFGTVVEGYLLQHLVVTVMWILGRRLNYAY